MLNKTDSKSIKSKKYHKLLFALIPLVILIFIIGGMCLNGHCPLARVLDTNHYDYTLDYDEQFDPVKSYHIKIDTKSRAVIVDIRTSCDAKDCNDDLTEHYGPTVLTNEEYTKVFSIIKDKKDAVPILESLARDQEKVDVNGRSITEREFANQWLDDVIEQR